MRPAPLALAAVLASLGCYAPEPEDCKVRCALDGTCPTGLTCEFDFCRPEGHPSASCGCRPGETRPCGGGTGVGECRVGAQRCGDNKAWEQCAGAVESAPELCDNKDNDCDGTVDEEVIDAPPCERTRGVCAGKSRTCVAGRFAATCAAAEYGPDYEDFESRCGDSLDNDCDGVVDGHAAGTVAAASAGFDLVALDGGYALVWGTVAGAGRAYTAQLFDARLSPVGAPVTLGTAATATSVRAAGAGTRAWVVWQHPSPAQPPLLDEAGGAAIDLASPGAAATPLGAVLHPQMRGTIRVAATPSGLIAAWPTDGGIGLSEWAAPGTAPAVRLAVPPHAAFAEAYDVGISSRGTTLAFAGKFFTDDAGTTDYFDGVYSLANGQSSYKFVQARSMLLDTPAGVQSVWDGFCNYDVFNFRCQKSYLVADFDVWNAGAALEEVRTGVPSAISGSHAAASGDAWVASWVESRQLYVGAPAPGSRTLRSARLDVGGSISGPTRVASSGGGLAAVVFAVNANPGRLEALVVCVP